jgi:hypothetical protein
MKTKIRQLEASLRAWRQRLLDARRFGDAEDVQSAEAQVRRGRACRDPAEGGGVNAGTQPQRRPSAHRLAAGDRVRDLRDVRGTVVAARYGSTGVQVLWDDGTAGESHRRDLEKLRQGRPRIRK